MFDFNDFEEMFSAPLFFLISIVLVFIFWVIIEAFSPGFFNPFQFWNLTENIPAAVFGCWPIFLYAAIATYVLWVFSRKRKLANKEAFLAKGIFKSIMAGLLEEIGFRCMFIFLAMVLIVAMNFLSFGLIMWINESIIFPLTDFVTLGMMHNIIYGFPPLMMAGALDANVWFRNGHKYLGLVGIINSWFIGLYFLCVMFTQGLIVAIIVHALYDIVVFSTEYVLIDREGA